MKHLRSASEYKGRRKMPTITRRGQRHWRDTQSGLSNYKIETEDDGVMTPSLELVLYHWILLIQMYGSMLNLM